MIFDLDLNLLQNSGLSPNEFTFLYCKVKGINYQCVVDVSSLQENGWCKILDNNEVSIRAKFLNLIGEKETRNNVESWISEYTNLWPEGVKSTSGKIVRGDNKTNLSKMKSFLKNYKSFTKDQILQATLAYVTDRKNANYGYMQTSYYFIMKDNISSLASWIENMDKREEKRDYFTKA
jgi:hypothetical protein